MLFFLVYEFRRAAWDGIWQWRVFKKIEGLGGQVFYFLHAVMLETDYGSVMIGMSIVKEYASEL